ncbi:MAG: ABC transporter ATP-binding protein [Pyrinomonadaceae bacterium]
MADRIVRVEDLTHRYPERVALDGVSFEVTPGEAFGLLGPNGGGKSTLFRILSTQLAPTKGTARVFGFDVEREAGEVRRRIGVVFQSQSVDGKLTVTENLRHQGHLYGLRGASLKARIEEMLARFGLAERASDRAEKLSGGLRRRVEIAKAMLHRPALLLLDEPTTGLDIGARLDLWNYLQSLRETEGVTIMLTTHTMEEAESCDRILLLDEGRAIALDTPAALKAKIGGDVVTAQSREPSALQAKIHARFGVSPTVVGDTVRIERERGHEFITELIEAFPGEIDAVTLSKPTLEDVFIQRTGHRFVERQH